MSPTVLALARSMSRVADFDARGTALSGDASSRHLEGVAFDLAYHQLLPAILTRADAEPLRALGERLRGTPVPRDEQVASLHATLDQLRDLGLGDATRNVDAYWSDEEGARRLSRDELAAAAVEVMASAAYLAVPEGPRSEQEQYLCGTGQPTLLLNAHPAFLVYFALGVGIEPWELEPLVLALLETMRAAS